MCRIRGDMETTPVFSALMSARKKVVRIEDAVRKMTSLPATTFRLAERGQLRPGFWADIVVFDPATVAGPFIYKDPHHYSSGFRYVFVNGAMVVHQDQHTGARPGKVIRRQKTEPIPPLQAPVSATPSPTAGS
jgi:N-acyl-D-aspartate/D-glutamate deacylase